LFNFLSHFQILIAEKNLIDAEIELICFDAMPIVAHYKEKIISKINIAKKVFDLTAPSEIFS